MNNEEIAQTLFDHHVARERRRLFSEWSNERISVAAVLAAMLAEITDLRAQLAAAEAK